MRARAYLLMTLVTVTIIASPLIAQDAPKPCSSAHARDFGFWVGAWEVTANEKVAGNNTITTILDGCVLLEEYSAASSAYTGKSFNYYDDADGKWHQVWVDNSGLRLHLSGGFADGRMVMSGERKQGDDTIVDRITWHNNDDGTVRQVWDVSKDGGASWNPVFDGLYTKQ
jgi:hypothetical protein